MNVLEKVGLICELIPPQEFEELTECAYEALDAQIRLGDRDDVSIREEYQMRIPKKFSKWLIATCHNKMIRHHPEYGFYNLKEEHLQIPIMWTNRMRKGEQHQIHVHGNSLYSFSAYIACGDNDAPFFFMHSDCLEYLHINEHSRGNVLIFPSSLPHSVSLKKTDGDRISVSGNIIYSIP